MRSGLRVRDFPLLAILFGGSTAWGTALLKWDVLELTRRSTVVVQGHVFHVATRFSADGMRILTDVDVQVDSVWKGTAGAQVRITQPGGTMDGMAQRVDGMASFAEGEEVVVFLEAQPQTRYGLIGMAQGKYRVDRSKGVRAVPESLTGTELVDPQTHQKVSPSTAPLDLEVLRAQVKAATPGTP